MEFKDNLRDSLKVTKEIRKLKSEIEAKRIYLDQINSYPYHPIIRVILKGLSNAYIDLEDNKNTEDYPYGYIVLFKQLIIQIMKMDNNDIDEKSIIDELFNNQLFTEGYLEYEELKTSNKELIGWRIFLSCKGHKLLEE